MMAVIFTSVNQNSSSPNTLTLNRFIAPMKKTTARTQIHLGTSGNQNCMYRPKAVTSARHTITISNVYVHPVMKPASGPRCLFAYSLNEPETGLRTAISPSARNTR